MTPQQMRDRTDRFSVEIIGFCRGELPADPLKLRILTQLQDAGTSVASNYHAACRAQSRAQFIAKLSICVEESDECVGWLHKLGAAKLAPATRLAPLQQEASELWRSCRRLARQPAVDGRPDHPIDNRSPIAD